MRSCAPRAARMLFGVSSCAHASSVRARYLAQLVRRYLGLAAFLYSCCFCISSLIMASEGNGDTLQDNQQLPPPLALANGLPLPPPPNDNPPNQLLDFCSALKDSLVSVLQENPGLLRPPPPARVTPESQNHG